MMEPVVLLLLRQLFCVLGVALRARAVPIAQRIAMFMCAVATARLPDAARDAMKSEVEEDIRDRIWEDLKAGLSTQEVAAKAVFHALSVLWNCPALRAEYRKYDVTSASSDETIASDDPEVRELIAQLEAQLRAKGRLARFSNGMRVNLVELIEVVPSPMARLVVATTGAATVTAVAAFVLALAEHSGSSALQLVAVGAVCALILAALGLSVYERWHSTKRWRGP